MAECQKVRLLMSRLCVSLLVFDYIRDHLGYRIELQEMTAPAVLLAGQANPVEISLINRGFSTLFNEHPVYPGLD